MLNKLVYNDGIDSLLTTFTLPYKIVFQTAADKANFAVLFKHTNDPLYVLAIRGTDLEFNENAFTNILQDFSIFSQKDWEIADTALKAVVSTGAFQGYKNVLSEVDVNTGLNLRQYINDKLAKNSTVIVSGHSLGGNIANLVASDLQYEYAKKINVNLVTFGAPASGNAGFVKHLDAKFPTGSRYEIDLDIATRFHSIPELQRTLEAFGLDSATALGSIKFGESTSTFNIGSLLYIAEKFSISTGILDEKRKYAQSSLQLRSLQGDRTAIEKHTTLSAALYNAFKFHSIDAYIELLGK
jgi:hypothetical protein